MPPFKKGEKITDPEILERLAKARQKALEKRQEKAQVKKDNKLLKDLKFKKTQEENEELKEFVNSNKKDKEPEKEVVEVRKKPKSKTYNKKVPKKRIVYVSDNESSDESSEEEVIVEKPKPKKSTPDTNDEESTPPPAPIQKSERELHLDKMFARCYGNSLY